MTEVLRLLTLSFDRRLPLHAVHVSKRDTPSQTAGTRLEIFIDNLLGLWPRLRSTWDHSPRAQRQVH